MRFTDIANDLLAMAAKRHQLFGDEISDLGEDTWLVMLTLYAAGDKAPVVRESALSEAMRFPTNLDRILSVLAGHDLVTGNISETGADRSFRITDKAVSTIEMVLDVADKPAPAAAENEAGTERA
ncbi:hypothetical protein [Sphingorhabdus sp. 109]|jgi:hypothetical protein|uniref:hypothetical protein n=1 Tax=Sphingorhabdus sp. 109 TaxID=2653173 RepID=UPI0012EF8933|nr:hypothetical protein [Sphingorhabdus sp. 109]VWX58555.1 conserved hypothetical protein [Sphingorhabdus sp. 109]